MAEGTKVAVFDSLGPSWEAFTAHPFRLVGGLFISNVAPGIIWLLVLVPTLFLTDTLKHQGIDKIAPEAAMGIICAVLGGGLVAGLIMTALRPGWILMVGKAAKGEEYSIGTLKEGLPFFLPFLGLNILYSLATMAGFLLLIVPGIFICLRFCLSPFVMVFEKKGPIESMKRSNQLVEGLTWPLLGFFLCYLVASVVVGLIPVGSIIFSLLAQPVLEILLAVLYFNRSAEIG